MATAEGSHGDKAEDELLYFKCSPEAQDAGANEKCEPSYIQRVGVSRLTALMLTTCLSPPGCRPSQTGPKASGGQGGFLQPSGEQSCIGT